MNFTAKHKNEQVLGVVMLSKILSTVNRQWFDMPDKARKMYQWKIKKKTGIINTTGSLWANLLFRKSMQ